MRRGRILTPLQIKLMDMQENGTFSTISINGISPGLREDWGLKRIILLLCTYSHYGTKKVAVACRRTKFCVAKTYHLAIYGNGWSKTWVPIYENAREAPKVVGAVFPNFPVGRVGLLFILAQNLFNFLDCALRGISTHSYRTLGRKNPKTKSGIETSAFVCWSNWSIWVGKTLKPNQGLKHEQQLDELRQQEGRKNP